MLHGAFRNRGDGRFWLALAAVQAACVFAAPTFYYHYAAFPAAAVCVLVGLAIARAPRAVLPVTAVAVLALGLVNSRPLRFHVPIDGAAVRAFAATADCVWSESPDVLLAADQAVRRAAPPCDA